MTSNDIKKLVYKQKPEAKLDYIRKGTAYYSAVIKVGDSNHPIRPADTKTIQFEVPGNDMGDADFTSDMDAKLLLRWLI